MQRLRLPDRLRLIATATLVALLAGAWVVRDRTREAVSYDRDVQPIFDAHCTSCHPAAYPYLDLRADRSYDDLYRVVAATNPAYERVVPGRPELSYLLTHPPDPSNAALLSDAERELLGRWISEGARR